MKQAIFFISHVYDATVERRFLTLKKEVSSYGDVYILTEHPDIFPSHLQQYIQSFNFFELKKMARNTLSDNVVPGSCHLFAIEMKKRFSSMEYFWFIEYDVVYTGKWSDFFEAVKEDTSDLIATYVGRKLSNSKHWFWIQTVKYPDGSPLLEEEFYKAFFPLYRISRKGLDVVEKAVSDGWTGHFEWIIPTVLKRAGCTLSEWGGYGFFTPLERRGKWYSRNRTVMLNTMRFRPEIIGYIFLQRKKLYHPVKTEPKQIRHILDLFKEEVMWRIRNVSQKIKKRFSRG